MFVAKSTSKKIIRNGSFESSLRDLSSLERASHRYANILIRYFDVLDDRKLREKVFISANIVYGQLQKLKNKIPNPDEETTEEIKMDLNPIPSGEIEDENFDINGEENKNDSEEENKQSETKKKPKSQVKKNTKKKTKSKEEYNENEAKSIINPATENQYPIDFKSFILNRQNSIQLLYVIWKLRNKFSENQKTQIEEWKTKIITPKIESFLPDFLKSSQIEKIQDEEEEEEKITFSSSFSYDPWENLNLLPNSKSLLYAPKTPCPKCKKDVWLFCNTCAKISNPKLNSIKLNLPFQLIVVFDQKLSKANRTASHALAISENQVDFQFVPRLFLPTEKAAVLYPSDNAKIIEDLTPEELKEFKTIIIIESTWNNSAKILKNHPQLNALPHIKFTQVKTLYWKNNGIGNQCLSTIETIYNLAKKFTILENKPLNTYDNLLLFFSLQLERLQKFYQNEKMISPITLQNLEI